MTPNDPRVKCKAPQARRSELLSLCCFKYDERHQNRCTIPTPTPTMLRDDEGVELKPSPSVAVALMMLPAPLLPSVWPFAR
ncbi:CRISPR-associated protein Cas5 [Paraburkholderia sp. CNPSo 3157]|uniref:CRISPR-associated protein Cas5 n=1 Tax=Paraburkholderia franconis TaxID=2654983 RepID=A0A7X1TKD0_9BURK|nr:CRISPR-associated protein Cas5 [Paraburkholderia franconis]